MARNSGKPQDNPLPEENRKELLDELSSVQDMLSEDQDGSGDEDPPMLEPESPGQAPEGGDEQQMPLLQSDSGEEGQDPANERLRQALSERPNPFLDDAARKSAQKNQGGRQQESPAAASGASSTPGTEARTSTASATAADTPNASADSGGAALTEEQIRAVVDETLAAWLPRIERELRDKLSERLRNQQG